MALYPEVAVLRDTVRDKGPQAQWKGQKVNSHSKELGDL
jgi:hypothetical protein